MRYRIAIAIMSVLALSGGLAAPAVAATTSGSWKQSCYPKSGTYASMLVENYPIATGQRYKITLKGDTGPALDVFVNKLYLNGALFYDAPGGTVGPKVIYKDYASKSTRATWKYEPYQAPYLFPDTCTVGAR